MIKELSFSLCENFKNFLEKVVDKNKNICYSNNSNRYYLAQRGD